MIDLHNRRSFLRAAAAASVAWAAADLLQIEDALAWAAQHASVDQPAALGVFTAAQAEAIDALASRILPAVDGRPGAHEAGAVYFIDRALATFNAAQKKLYVHGIDDLNRRASRRSKGTLTFARLATGQQDEIVKQIEKTPFFEAARFDTIVGVFALPKWGGNREYAGWQMLGLTHQPAFQPPFGYYDGEGGSN